MPSFPYFKEKVKDGYVPRPKIPVTINYKGNSMDTPGYIDSGSDITLVPRSMAKCLGIELRGKVTEKT